MEAIVLAGGLGTRLRSLVADVPKPMARIEGRPFLEYQLNYWSEQGIEHFVLSVGYKYEAIVAHFGTTFGEATIDYAIEPEPLGTGGGLLLAMEKLRSQESFLVINGDTFFEVELEALKRFHTERLADLTMCLFESDRRGRYLGIALDARFRVASLGDATCGGLANGGVYLMRPAVFSAIPWKVGDRVSLEDDLLPVAKQNRRELLGFACSGRFIDIGIPEDFLRAGAILNR